MNHKALYDYVMLILSDSHLAVLQVEGNDERNVEIVENLLNAIKKMDYLYHREVIVRLWTLAAGNDELQQRMSREEILKRKNRSSERSLPWIVLTIVLVLCLAMYFYSIHRN
jgi:hypothetical protein